MQVYGVAGAAHIAEKAANGQPVPVRLTRIKTERREDVNAYRWYNLYQMPDSSGGGEVRVPLLNDGKNSIAENHRAIPPDDPDYFDLYHIRSDAESLNRAFDDSLWLRRSHSMGTIAHLLDWLGFGLAINSLTRGRVRRKHSGAPPGAQAA